MREKIVFTADDGEKIELFVEEETRVGGRSYLLVTDSDSEEANAWILKDTSAEGDEEASYEPVEDDVEFEAIAGIFEKMVDGTVISD